MRSTGTRRLNNFVAQLQTATIGDRSSSFSFRNPRNGWIYIEAASNHSAAVRVYLDKVSEDSLIGLLHPGTDRMEAMRYLDRGEHLVMLEADGHHETRALVRAVPEIIYANFPGNPHLAEYGSYDWDFLHRVGMLSSANVIITGDPGGRWAEKWRADGKRILQQVGVPGLRKGEDVDAQSAYEYWSRSPGWNSPLSSGLIADEFLTHRDEKVPAWSEAIHRLLADKPDRVFYPYVGGDPEGLRSLIESLADTPCRFACERYLKEQATESAAIRFLREELEVAVKGFCSLMPGFQKHLVFVLGLLCGPPETLNTNPAVDYKVFMDMQFNFIANDPAFEGIYGIEEYLSSYADEEYLRWAAHLYRHYCIDGRRGRATGDPYHLDHIENPDFARGLQGWTVSPALPGSVGIEEMEGIGWLQGRYPRDREGDRYLHMSRCAEGPNAVSQEIRNLQPGRPYSVKMYVWDADDPTTNLKHGIGVVIDQARSLPELSFQGIYPNCYSHLVPRSGEVKTYFNFLRTVFRPRSDCAKLAISDWIDNAPAGPVGQRLALNFVEVEPFYTGGLGPDGTARPR